MDNVKTLRKVVTFRSDGCSGIPDGPYSECCDRHDFYYYYRGEFAWLPYSEQGNLIKNPEPVTRKGADRLLQHCMQQYEDRLFSQFVYLAVRALGWIWWYDIPEKLSKYKNFFSLSTNSNNWLD